MKERLISAGVALAIIIPLLIIGGVPFRIAVGILGILAYREIINLKVFEKKLPNIIKMLGLISLLVIIMSKELSSFSIILPLLLLLLPIVFVNSNKYNSTDALYLLGFVMFCGITFNSFIFLRNVDLNLIIYLLSITIITDTCAYLVGRLIGKHKMCESISPNKTWEGAFGGLIGGTIIPIIIYVNLIADFSIKLLLITIILSTIGQIGDLVYSKIKRDNNIKDFSNIMPGHGGILDRVDSFSFVTLAYILMVYIF